MIYRGRECERREFSDETGSGTEWLLDDKVVVREHATRVRTQQEIEAERAWREAQDKERVRADELAGIAAKSAAGTDTPADREKALKLILAAPSVARAVAAIAGGEKIEGR